MLRIHPSSMHIWLTSLRLTTVIWPHTLTHKRTHLSILCGPCIYAFPPLPFHHRHSPFWQEFNFTEFAEDIRNGRFGEGFEEIKRDLDVEGEAHACKILGVERGDELSVIKKAHRRLALQFHPDKVRHMSTCEEHVKRRSGNHRNHRNHLPGLASGLLLWLPP